jgi:hypothetical protein
MHPGIREIIRTSNYCQAAVIEAAALLPEDDAELDGWIGKVVEEQDVSAFAYLVLPAIHLRRKVAARHVEGGMRLMPNPLMCGCVLWHPDGEDLAADFHSLTRKSPRHSFQHEKNQGRASSARP